MIAGATIAAARWGLQPVPHPESVAFTQRMLGRSRADRRLLWSLGWAPTSALWRLVERFAAPGFVPHVARRKAWIQEHCRDSIAAGYRRVIIVAAGLDSLGVRLAEASPGVEVVELDHPATQRIKREAQGPEDANKVRLIPIDLTDRDVAPTLGTGPTSAPTLVVAEGLLMYLPEARVERLFDDLCTLTNGPLRLILTFMERRADDSINFQRQGSLVRSWLRSVGEPFQWGATREEVRAMLERRDLRVIEIAGDGDLSARWPGRVAEGEVLVVAERAPRA